MECVERLYHDGKVAAILVKKGFNKKGLTFITDDNFSLQLGVHLQDKGFKAKPHKHIPFEELKNLEAQEIFYVEKGRIIAGLYDDNGKKIGDIEGLQGDIIIINAGHSLTCLEDSKFIEIKQGPYRGEKEKKYFN